MNEKEKLTRLNHLIRDAEWTRDYPFMENILTNDFIFRRADGSIADRNIYLADLKDHNNTYEQLDICDVEVSMNENDNNAIVTLVVKASGKRGKEELPFHGTFKNVRFFRKENEWQLYAWYNEVAGIITHIPNSEYKDTRYKDAKTEDFCGTVFTEELPGLPISPHLRAVYVKFINGAFTKWHFHTDMQILLVKEGQGFVEQKGYPSFDILQGDRIYIPANVWHRHGAKKEESMVHLAITNGETTWDKNDLCN